MRLTTTRSLLLAIGGMLLSPLGFSQEKQEEPRAVEPIPARYASVDVVALVVESVEKTEHGLYAKVRLINPTRLAVCFEGTDEGSSPYRLQQRTPSSSTSKTEPEWEDVYTGWFCGFSFRDCVIKSGESAVIDVRLSKSGVLTRVGIEYREGTQEGPTRTVWSPSFSVP